MLARAAGAAVLCALLLGCAGSGEEPATSTTMALPFDRPSRATIESATGLVLPGSTAGFRAAQRDPTQVDVSATVATADVDAMVAASALPALETVRRISHSSPVWELNPAGAVRSTEVTRNGLRVVVELADRGDATSELRLQVSAVPAS